jgi:hypothetical protein
MGAGRWISCDSGWCGGGEGVTTITGEPFSVGIYTCILITAEDGTVRRQFRTLSTMTDELLMLADWLDQWGVTHVAMESTGVY